MPSAYLGRNASLKTGDAANSLTTMSGDGSGLANVQLEDTVESRDIPGQGTGVHRQSIGVHDRTLTFTVDANATTWARFWNRNGETEFFEWGPRGSASGMPKVTGSGILQVSLNGGNADALTFDVTITISGNTTVGTF